MLLQRAWVSLVFYAFLSLVRSIPIPLLLAGSMMNVLVKGPTAQGSSGFGSYASHNEPSVV
jgi:hypothetical protein